MHKNKRNEEHTQITEITRSRVKQSFLHFGSLYRVKSLGWQIAVSVVLGLLFGVVEFALLQITGMYQLGIGALAQGVARFVRIYNNSLWLFNVLFWLVSFLGNVPLFIFAYFKINKRFALLNFVFLITSTLSGFITAWIPESKEWFIFGDPNTVLNAQDGVTNVLASVEIGLWEVGQLREFSIFLYAILYGTLQAIFNAALLITESSTAGFDIIAIYLAKKKFRDLGSVFLIVHLVCLTVANLMGTYIPAAVALSGQKTNLTFSPWALQNFFSLTFVAGILMIVVNALILNILFPKFKVVKVEVYSRKVNEIQNLIYSSRKSIYVTTTIQGTGGYSKKTQNILITNCLYIDAADLLALVKSIDPDAFVSVIDIKKVDGYVFTSQARR
ncbi:DUF2179 domain-containing protein [Mycoplasmopsis californica]|nr:DUF2179 domain-containing protein [Mycoplasmopsis californica]